MDERDEDDGLSYKEDDLPNGRCSATSTSELDDMAATSSVKSEGDLDDKSLATASSGNSDPQNASSETPPVQSTTLPPSSSRLMRNLAEKMRRDKLNMYISELSSLVPIVAMATKRMDKTSVLRLSANFLRIHLSLKQNKKPEAAAASTAAAAGGGGARLAPEGLEANLSTMLLEALEGFMLIVTSSGKIVYVSDSVEKLLGHSQLDLMGQSLYTICHNGDHELIRHHLQPSSFDTKSDGGSDDSNGGTGSSSSSAVAQLSDYIPRSPSFFGGKPEDALSGLASGERRSFYARLAERSMARGDPARHVTVHLIGILRPPSNKKDTPKKGKKDFSSTSSDEHMLVCVARPFRNKGITELSLMEAVQDEYVTRHLPDGRIIYSDHRIAFVAGYLTEEVMGLSAFNFIHQDDLPWATVANRQMFSSVDGQGYTVYRLRSKTGSLIHLRTRGYLEFNKTTQKVETFVCINTLLTPEEGDKELEKERERITPFITFQQVTTSTNSSSVSSGTAQAITQGSTSNAVSQALQQGGSISSQLSILGRNEKCLPALCGTPSMNSSVELVELPCEDSVGILSPQLVSTVTDLQMNGTVMNRLDSLTSISPPPSVVMAPTATTTAELVGTGPLLFDQTGQELLHLRSTTNSSRLNESHGMSSPGDLLPRLKRSLAEVDDLVVTSSAKRSIVPTSFITSYSPLHPPSHLGNKWGTETTTTIIFDQHNNNG